MTTYARVIDNQIVEYPVPEVCITTRAHPLEWYTPCVFDDLPDVPPFHYTVEVPELVDNAVHVHYRLQPMSLDILLSELPANTESTSNPSKHTDIAPPTPEMLERIHTLIMERVQQTLNDFAATRGYGDANTSPIVSACSYALSNDPVFSAEGKYCVQLRDDTYRAVLKYIDEYSTGAVPYPNTWQDILKVMPVMEWPNT